MLITKRIIQILPAILLVLLLARTAGAQVSPAPAPVALHTTFGWGNGIRIGRWNPIFVNIAAPVVRPVVIEIHAGYGEGAAMLVAESSVEQPAASTYRVLFPMNVQPTQAVVTIRDADTGKTLASQLVEDMSRYTAAGHTPKKKVPGDQSFIAICGNVSQSMQLASQLSQALVGVGVLDPIPPEVLHAEAGLPENAAGYDGLSVLILDEPSLQAINAKQQAAILDWVDAGGNLLLIPGSDPLPAKSAILDAMPAVVGENQLVDLAGSGAVLSGTTVPNGTVVSNGTEFFNGIAASQPSATQSSATQAATSQPSGLNSRLLTPRANAQKIDLHGGALGKIALTGYTSRYGLGQVAIEPAGISAFTFASPAEAAGFWRTMLAGMIDVPAPKAPTEVEVTDAIEDAPRPTPVEAHTKEHLVGRGERETNAIHDALTALDPQVGKNDRRWMPLLLALMGFFAVAGPFDSILLMKVGRRPRTWLTGLSWIGLLVCAAGYGALHFEPATVRVRTLRLIDQADNKTVAQTDLVIVSSNAAMRLNLAMDKAEWWEPANQLVGSLPADRFVDIAFHEDQDGCRPDAVDLTQDDAMSFRGEVMGKASPMIQAHLSIHRDSAGKPVLVGSVRNVSGVAMADVQIATASGVCRVGDGNLAAGATVAVNAALSDQAISLAGLPADVGDIAPDRARRAEDLLKANCACVYGQMPDAPAVNFTTDVPAESHWQVLRATVGLGQ
jgi:hypothetical protein